MAEAATNDFRALSAELHRGLVAYGLKPIEVLLLLILCDETFERDQVAGKVDLERWARMLGWRADKLERMVWRELTEVLRIVDHNAAEGTYQIRPDYRAWPPYRGWRAKAHDHGPDLEFQFSAERPLSEALCERSREAALRENGRRSHEPPAVLLQGQKEPDWKGLMAAIERGTVEQDFPVAEKSAGLSSQPGGKIRQNGNGPPSEKSAMTQTSAALALASVAEKSSQNPQLAVAEPASFQKKLSSASRRPQAAEKSAGAPDAFAWLESLDRTSCLVDPVVAAQWRELCERDPGYVLGKLRRRYEARAAKLKREGDQVERPLGLLSVMARDDRAMRRL